MAGKAFKENTRQYMNVALNVFEVINKKTRTTPNDAVLFLIVYFEHIERVNPVFTLVNLTMYLPVGCFV